MTIGLDKTELINVFLTSFTNVESKLRMEKFTFNMGADPEAKKLFESMQSKAPNATFDDINLMIGVLFAITDVIIANNESIYEAVSHLDQK
jgi:hypothetical protein